MQETLNEPKIQILASSHSIFATLDTKTKSGYDIIGGCTDNLANNRSWSVTTAFRIDVPTGGPTECIKTPVHSQIYKQTLMKRPEQ